MFGYIRPDAGQLRVCEYETYRAVYCGICHALKEHFGTLSTLSLNYDFTFAALLGLALKPGFPGYESFTCAAHPFHKRQRVKLEEEVLPYVGGCVVSMAHAKIADNIADSGFLKSTVCRLTLPLTARAEKKAGGKFPALPALCEKMTAEQDKIEQDPGASLDAARRAIRRGARGDDGGAVGRRDGKADPETVWVPAGEMDLLYRRPRRSGRRLKGGRFQPVYQAVWAHRPPCRRKRGRRSGITAGNCSTSPAPRWRRPMNYWN